MKGKFDVFLVSESKLDSSLWEGPFKIPSYRIFRHDQGKYVGGLIFCINQNISYKKIETFQFPSSIEILTLVINVGKEKLSIFGTYKSPYINNGSFLNEVYNAITFYSTLYKNFILFGDLNKVRDNTQSEHFCEYFLLNTSSKIQLATRTILDEIFNNSFDIFPEEFKTCLAKFIPLKEKKNWFKTASSWLKM